MIRDFFSAVLVLVVAGSVAGWFAKRSFGPAAGETHLGSSVSKKKQQTEPDAPIIEFIRRWNDKKPPQAGINCFGTTLAAFGASRVPRFASDREMSSFLAHSCRELSDKEAGLPFDVGVVFDGSSGDPAHSFLILKRTLAFYKDGVEAGTSFKGGSLGSMLREFRVGFSKEKCDELISKATEESGLPCPGVAKRYRCKPDSTFTWPALDEVETFLYTIVAKRAVVTPQEKAQVARGLRELVRVDAIAVVSKASDVDKNLLRERLASLDSFFTFYADRSTWGEGDIRGYRESIKLAKESLVTDSAQ